MTTIFDLARKRILTVEEIENVSKEFQKKEKDFYLEKLKPLILI